MESTKPTLVPDLVPARMVNEYAYCPRLAYLEWVQGEWADNFDTAEGRFKHRVVDREGGALAEDTSEEGEIHARSVWLSALGEKITARADLIEGNGGKLTPVDYKRGKVPDNIEKSWEADRVQVCAQGLVLRENGYSCDEGIIYYTASKTRITVPFDDVLVARTREIVESLLSMALSGSIPPPLEDSPKCVRCSLAGICLPDEVAFLSSGDRLGHDDGLRRIMPARDDALPLYVQKQGAYVSKKGGVLEISLKGKRIAKARLFEVSHVCLFGGVHLTMPALSELLQRGIPVSFFTQGGWFRGMASGMPAKNVELRKAQFRAAEDPAASLNIASKMVAAKIENSRTLLMRNHKDLSEIVTRELSRLAKAALDAESIESLLGLEGAAARVYFSVFDGMLKRRDDSGESESMSFDFNGRNRRPPLDPVNAMLSLAYSMLAKEAAVACLSVGFDPYLGFLHQPRFGRPSLALDLMEEFRPIVADSVVLWAINNGVVSGKDFIKRGPAVALKSHGRKKFLQAYEKRMDALVTHPIFGYRIGYRRVIEVQARLLGRVLLGELKEYPGFRTR